MKRIRKMAQNHHESIVFLNNYIEESLKSKTRFKQTFSARLRLGDYDVHDETDIAADPFKGLRSSSKTKSD